MKTNWLIHLFAILHLATSAICSLAGLDDALLLTVLTITLTLIICLRAKIKVEFTAVCIVLVNVFGFLLGSGFAWLVSWVTGTPLWAHALSAMLTTEALGWGLYALTIRYGRDTSDTTEEDRGRQMSWLVTAVVVIFIVRICVNLTIGTAGSDTAELAKQFIYNPLVLLIILGVSILFVEYNKKENKDLSYAGKAFTMGLFFVTMVLFSALFVALGLPFHFKLELSPNEFVRLGIISLIANATIFSIVYLADYALTASRNLELEKEKANKARYQYLMLKQQVNPHFLFNSLNVLDSLVLEGSKEDASRFIHQLSGLYRYLLKCENEDVVSLHDEMEYARMYGSLVQTRWQDALSIDFAVRESDLGRYVVPCSVQLCIENAIKHNTLSAKEPLRISIRSDGAFVTVSNPLSPKITDVQSTGVGLNYIRQQYLSNGGHGVEVEHGTDSFTIKLPLL